MSLALTFWLGLSLALRRESSGEESACAVQRLAFNVILNMFLFIYAALHVVCTIFRLKSFAPLAATNRKHAACNVQQQLLHPFSQGSPAIRAALN